MDIQRYPNEHFVRFVARNFYGVSDRVRVRFLDIGSGGGANSWFLAQEGFSVTALDKSQKAIDAMVERLNREGERKPWALHRITPICYDIAQAPLGEGVFDCIADINTLCHVENPPMHLIADALKKGGKFFCVAPQEGTWEARVGEGKPYTRYADRYDMRELLKPFPFIDFNWAGYSEGGHNMMSWLVEAHL